MFNYIFQPIHCYWYWYHFVIKISQITNYNLNFMWKRFQIKNNQKEHLSLMDRGSNTDHTQQKLILLLAQGETPMSSILCGYEYWVSFWLVGLGSISHISSDLAVVIPLRGSHFSCHRGRAAPYTLNDLSPWRNHQRLCPLPGLIETDFLTSLDLVS